MVRLNDPAKDARYIIDLLPGCKAVGDTSRIVSGISIDSRDISNDVLFVPLKGERVDGHNYIVTAHKNGARTFLLGSDYHEKLNELTEQCSDALFICIDDTLAALQQMARNHVNRFKAIKKVGITGSSGKTTTKECIVSILSCKGKVVCNAGNLNSEIGLPLSVMAMCDDDEYAVFEMGMNRTGEMDILADILQPQYAVITNIGTAHIGLLGSQQAIAFEKRKALKYVHNSRNAVLWDEDEYLEFLSSSFADPCTLFGMESMKDIVDVQPQGLDGSILTYRDIEINLRLPGKYNTNNALSAIRIAELLDVSPGMIKEGLESVQPLFGRSQVWKGRVVILSDCYNANLESMKSSIEFFASLDEKGVKHFVLGSMKELGDETEDAHKSLGLFLSKYAENDQIYLFGLEMKSAYKELRTSHNVFWTDNYEELKNRLLSSLGVGDYVLLKGSRSMELERLIEQIENSVKGSAVC